jgi:hypothetical protein
MTMKPLYRLVVAAALALSASALAQPAPPALPSLTGEQSARVQDQLAAERRTMEARVARGEVTPDEAERFLGWREWQIAQQVAGVAPPPATTAPPPAPLARRYVYTYPAPYYYAPPPPYYWGPRYYGGPVVCAGGWGRHVGGRFCF